MNKSGQKPLSPPNPPTRRAAPVRRERPASPPLRSPASSLDAATKRRLIWLAAGLGALVFVLGTVAFAVFFTLSPDRGLPVEEATGVQDAILSGQSETALPAAQPRAGGELVHLVGQDVNSFSPLFATGETAQMVMDLLFPRLLGQDPHTGLPAPTELAERWEIGADGRTYTFSLRNNITWSDGTPVTAEDFVYTYTALGNPDVDSPYQSRNAFIESVHAPDAYTLVVTLGAPNCSALHSLRHPLLPSHVYAADGSDLRTNTQVQTPTISAGPLHFESHVPGASIVLARNPAYWQGATLLERYTLSIEADVEEQARRLAAGTAHLARVPNGSQRLGAAWQSLLFEGGGNVTVNLSPQPDYLFLAANLADPNQPQPGRTGADSDSGADMLQAQAAHPILGDGAVRRGLALALNTDTLLQIGWDGNRGYALGGYLLPTLPWANPNPPAPLAHDPEQAGQLLEAAGWILESDGVRRRAGMPLALRLMTNEDNPRRVALAQAIADDLATAGVQVRLELLSFERMAAELLEQRFDLSLGGWDNLAPDPGLHPFWHSRNDLPGQGFNFVSFQDADVDLWLDQALTLPGCAPDARGALYAQAQQRVQAELPYLLLLGTQGGWAYSSEWHNINPGPWQLHNNVQQWGQVE